MLYLLWNMNNEKIKNISIKFLIRFFLNSTTSTTFLFNNNK